MPGLPLSWRGNEGEVNMSILIKNANIIGAADNYTGDIFIQGECIAAIGKNLDIKADK